MQNQAIPTLLPVYQRADVAFERGEGAWLYTADGETYLDCMAGIAVTALGHAHPQAGRGLKDQAEKLWHVSNIFRIPGQEKLAERLAAATFADVVFFTNSGAEAIECAIKRRAQIPRAKGEPERIDIIGFEGSFHGRTLAAVSAPRASSYLEGFGPPLPGFVHVPFGDLEALQGRGRAEDRGDPDRAGAGRGRHARRCRDECLQGIRQLCDENGALLIYDEIQMRPGPDRQAVRLRVGRASTPDIMAIAKALGGGFPVGACLATAEAARA